MPLKEYIQGNKEGKEANRLEREAMNDPFLEEALEGFEAVAGNHVPVINRLEKRFAAPAVRRKKKKYVFSYLPIAASILLILGIAAYFLVTVAPPDTAVLADIQIAEEEALPMDLPPVQAEQSIQKESAKQASIKASVAKEENTRVLREQELSESVAAEMVVADVDRAYAKTQLSDAKEKIAVFGEEEFKAYCQQYADKTVRNETHDTVQVSFFIDKTGKPSQIEWQKYSSEKAKARVETLLSSSPAWTNTERKVTLTLQW
jgi:predicted RND superfamily exporter protein